MNRIEKHFKKYKTVKQLADKVKHIRDDNAQIYILLTKKNFMLYGMN